jgi:hypothetical protein
MSVSARGLFRIARGTPLRAMHTGGRQIPNNPTPSTSPHNPHDPHLHHQALTFPPENALHEAETTEIDSTRSTKTSPIKKAAAYSLPPTRHSPHPLATHTPKGKLIPTRPPALTTAPRSEEDKTSHMHPLWKFFRTPEEGPARYPLGGMGMTAEELQGLPSMTGEDAGMGMGSLEPLLENDRNLKSGELSDVCSCGCLFMERVVIHLKRSIMDDARAPSQVLQRLAYSLVSFAQREKRTCHPARGKETFGTERGRRAVDQARFQGEYFLTFCPAVSILTVDSIGFNYYR